MDDKDDEYDSGIIFDRDVQNLRRIKRKRQINRDGEKENRTGWSQEKPSGAVNYMDLIMEPLRFAVI